MGIKGVMKHNNVVDMSEPPEQRHRKRRGTGDKGERPTAQMDRATTPRARRRSRDGEKKMRQSRADPDK